MLDWLIPSRPSVAPTKSISVDVVPPEVEQVLHLQEPQRFIPSRGSAVHSSYEQEREKRGKENTSVASVSPVEIKDDVSTGNISSRHGLESEDRKRLKRCEKEKAEMGRDLQQMAEKLHRAEFRSRDSTVALNDSRSKIAMLEQELHDRQILLQAKSGELESVKRRCAELQESKRRQSEELYVVKEELRRAEAQHAQTRHLLEERTTELKGAQRFLSQTDFLSGAEVISMAESLNAEILQGAAYMADSLEFSYRRTTEESVTESCRRARRALGGPMMNVLRSRWEQHETDLDPTPVQIALQIVMIYFSVMIAEFWIPGKGNENDILAHIFARISEKEEQAVSGRWRSMTRAYSKTWDTPDFAINAVVDALVHVLTIAGWAQQENKEADFNRMFRGRVSVIVELALRLRKGIGEDITSAHIHLKACHSGEEFDSRVMDDTYADSRRNGEQMRGVISTSSANSASEKVAGTTEIGLVRVVKGHQPEMLLKPKVVLCSAL